MASILKFTGLRTRNNDDEAPKAPKPASRKSVEARAQEVPLRDVAGTLAAVSCMPGKNSFVFIPNDWSRFFQERAKLKELLPPEAVYEGPKPEDVLKETRSLLFTLRGGGEVSGASTPRHCKQQ